MLKPLQLSMETKSDRLKGRALALVQSLIANHMLPPESRDAIVAMLSCAEKNTDENVQLKTLQIVLTMLQSPLRPRNEDQIGALLGICLRLTSKKGHKDVVLTTAAATVRQAVALVLSYVDVESELQRQRQSLHGSGGGVDGEPRPAQRAVPSGSATSAALKLIEDLCNMALGAARRPARSRAGLAPQRECLVSSACIAALCLHLTDMALCLRCCPSCSAGAPLTWLQSPSLPRSFVVELLDFMLVSSPAIFWQLPPFQHVLATRMPQLIQAQLQDHLDAGAAAAAFAGSNVATFKALLRLARTMLCSFYLLLGPRSSTLVKAVLAGTPGLQHACHANVMSFFAYPLQAWLRNTRCTSALLPCSSSASC